MSVTAFSDLIIYRRTSHGTFEDRAFYQRTESSDPQLPSSQSLNIRNRKKISRDPNFMTFLQ